MQQRFDDTLSRLANRKMSQITRDDVQQLKEQLGKKNENGKGGKYTANRTLQLLRAIYNKAIKWEMVDCRNPVAGIELYKEQARNRFLTREEIERLLTLLLTDAPPEPQMTPVSHDTKDFILLCMLTGQRKANVLAMRFSHIDFTRATWTIPGSEMKNGQPHVVALTALEIQVLDGRQRSQPREFLGSDYVFPGTGATEHLHCVTKSWVTLRTQAKIPDVTIHDLRRNRGSWMASRNVNVALIGDALAHRDMKTTLKVYAHTAHDDQREGRLVAHQAMLEAAGPVGKQMLRVVENELRKDKPQVAKRPGSTRSRRRH